MSKLEITDQPTISCPMENQLRFSWKCQKCIHYQGTDEIPVRINCDFKKE